MHFWYKTELGMTASVTIKVRNCLIKILKKKANYQEALILCPDELVSFKAEDDQTAKMGCQWTLALIY